MEARVADSLVARRRPGAAGRPLLPDRCTAHRHRHLWRAELRRGAAPPRDRPAHGPGSPAAAGPHPVPHPRPAPAGGRHGARRPRLLAEWAWALQSVLFEVPPLHAATLAAAAVILGAVSPPRLPAAVGPRRPDLAHGGPRRRSSLQGREKPILFRGPPRTTSRTGWICERQCRVSAQAKVPVSASLLVGNPPPQKAK